MARDFLSTGLSPVAQAQEWKVGTSDPSSAGNWKGGEGVKGQEEADRHEGGVLGLCASEDGSPGARGRLVVVTGSEDAGVYDF